MELFTGYGKWKSSRAPGEKGLVEIQERKWPDLLFLNQAISIDIVQIER